VLATLRDMDPQIPPPNPEIVSLKVV
jgi:hypothetical protein